MLSYVQTSNIFKPVKPSDYMYKCIATIIMPGLFEPGETHMENKQQLDSFTDKKKYVFGAQPPAEDVDAECGST